MKKILIINELNGRSFGTTMEDPTQWISDCIFNNLWGLPERWELNPVEGRVLETRIVSSEGLSDYTEYKIKADYIITIEDITNSYNIEQLRNKRNKILVDTDKFMISDYPITSEEKSQYLLYRQYLRDLPEVNPLPEVPMTFEEFVASL